MADTLDTFDLGEFVRRVLAEDLGSGGDVTSRATIAADARFTATMNCREPITLAGLDIAVAARGQREDSGWQGLVKLYQNMKPRDAATILNDLDMAVANG